MRFAWIGLGGRAMEYQYNKMLEIMGTSIEDMSNLKNFKQIQVQGISRLIDKKTDIGFLLRVNAMVKINEKRLINSPKSISLGGQRLTGKILVVDGEVIHTIEYVDCDTCQAVHSANLALHFSTYIVLDSTFETESRVDIVAYNEDIFIKQINKRKIYFSDMILLNVVNLDSI